MFPKQETIARKLELSLRTINRHMAELRAAGLVDVQHRGPSSSLYRLTHQQVTGENGVALPVVENMPISVEIPVQKLRNGVAFGVAFGVASAPHLLLRGLRTTLPVSETVAVGDDDGFPARKTQTPDTPPSDGFDPPPSGIVSAFASERQDGPSASISGEVTVKSPCRSLAQARKPQDRAGPGFAAAIAQLAMVKRIGGSK